MNHKNFQANSCQRDENFYGEFYLAKNSEN